MKPHQLLDYGELYAELEATARGELWGRKLREAVDEAFSDGKNGHLERWMEALRSLPELRPDALDFQAGSVSCRGPISQDEQAQLHQALLNLKPWRKGPFQLWDTFIDTEWRSNLKWDRLAPHLDLQGKNVLDVGCGNGYYGWRMLGAGARSVVGLDPTLLYLVQHAALRKYFGKLPNYVLPAGDTIISENLRLFDTVLSMGVLYHRKSPIEHLQLLGQAVKLGGEVVVETLVIDGDDYQCLVPEDRYAKMRNVWFLPTCKLLERMMVRCGFSDVRVVDVTPTTVEEQRGTEWMTFESLPDFLDPADPSRTVEGYQSPTRAIVLARKG